VALRPVRSDYDQQPENDPHARARAEAARRSAHVRGLGRPDLDVPRHLGRIAEAEAALDKLQFPPPARVVTGIPVPVAEVRMAVEVGPPSSEDDVDDADRAYTSNAVRMAYRRIAELTR
jgi:hypothetical protein